MFSLLVPSLGFYLFSLKPNAHLDSTPPLPNSQTTSSGVKQLRRNALSNGGSAAAAAAASADGNAAADDTEQAEDAEEQSEECEVERIVSHSGPPERYLVRWSGFPPSEDSWLSREELEGGAADLLYRYLDRVKEVEVRNKPRESFLDDEAIDADGSVSDDEEEEEEDEEERGRKKKKQKKLQRQSNLDDDDADGQIRTL